MDWYRGKRKIATAIHLDLTHHQKRYAAELQNAVEAGVRWLDVGCGHNIVPDWAMASEEQEQLVRRAAFLVGVDVDDGILRHPHLTHRIKALCGQLPFKDDAFDLVTANMVIEHVNDPETFLHDIFRVLRPGGHFLFVTPNCLTPMLLISRIVPDAIKKRVVRFLEHREFEDVFPTRYKMNRPRTIANYANETGFKIKQLKLIGTSTDQLGALSWIECLLLKAEQDWFHGQLQPDLLGVLMSKKSAKV